MAGGLCQKARSETGNQLRKDMSVEQEIDRIAGLLVGRELNRHSLAVAFRIASPALMTGRCKCEWEWEGGWVSRTPHNMDLIEAAIRQHIDDVVTLRALRSHTAQ